eukprot:6191257-Pleurochrysis_carterae.AAC.2
MRALLCGGVWSRLCECPSARRSLLRIQSALPALSADGAIGGAIGCGSHADRERERAVCSNGDLRLHGRLGDAAAPHEAVERASAQSSRGRGGMHTDEAVRPSILHDLTRPLAIAHERVHSPAGVPE